MEPNDTNPPATAQPPIQWDYSQSRDLQHPNVCTVGLDEGDMAVLFGSAQGSADQDVKVDVQARVLLRPVAAKLLRDLLAENLQRHEALHGPIPGYQPLPGSRALAPQSVQEPLLEAGELSGKGLLLFELVDGLGLAYDLERSAKILQGQFLTNRFLMSLATKALTPQAKLRLPIICKRLGMPAPFLLEFQKEMEQADFIHFGFEENENGATFKAYVEQVDGVISAMSGQTPNPEPFLLYRGYKWDAANPESKGISNYVCHPRLPVEGIRRQLAKCFPGQDHAPSRALANDVLMVASATIAPNDLLYVEVTDEDSGETSGRHSFDLNLYAGKLQLCEFYPVLLGMAARFEIGTQTFSTFYNRFKNRIFGHISGGVDRKGRGFLTLYFGRERRGGKP